MRPEFSDYYAAHYTTLNSVRATHLLGHKTKTIIETSDFRIADDFYHNIIGKRIGSTTNFRCFVRTHQVRAFAEQIKAASVIVTNNPHVVETAKQLGATLHVQFSKTDKLTVTVTHL